jgi:uncharacterized phosphatase
MKIWLVRHGETDWNKLGRIQGRNSQIPLNSNGIDQAIQLNNKISSMMDTHNFELVVHSSLLRSRQTADLLEISGAERIELCEFDELSYGSLEGKYFSECEELAEIKGLWARGNVQSKCPDGESLQEVVERMKKGIQRIKNRLGGKDAIVVSHGTAIRALVSHLKGVHYARIDKVHNCAVTILEIGDDEWKIVEYNKSLKY